MKTNRVLTIISIVVVLLAFLAGLSPALSEAPRLAEPLPDLIVRYLQITLEDSGSCVLGDPYPPLGTAAFIANIGDADAGPFVLQVNDTTTLVADGLAAGGEARIWVPTYRWPAENTSFVDSTFVVEESNEDNNAFGSIVPIPTMLPTCTRTPTATSTPEEPTPTFTPTITPSPTPFPVVTGDLGFRALSGAVRGAGASTPLAGAAVSYTHLARVRPGSADSTLTGEDGRYTFAPIFLHDTDTVIVRAVAQGYATAEVQRAGLTTWQNPVFDFLLEAWTPTPTRPARLSLPLVLK